MKITCWVLLSIPLKTSPKLPLPIPPWFGEPNLGVHFLHKKKILVDVYGFQRSIIIITGQTSSKLSPINCQSVFHELDFQSVLHNTLGIEKELPWPPLYDIFFRVYTILHILGFDTIITRYLWYFQFCKNTRNFRKCNISVKFLKSPYNTHQIILSVHKIHQFMLICVRP